MAWHATASSGVARRTTRAPPASVSGTLTDRTVDPSPAPGRTARLTSWGLRRPAALVRLSYRAPRATDVESKHAGHTLESVYMESTAQLGQLFDLAGVLSGVHEPDRAVVAALPLLRQLAGAEAVLLVSAADQ